MSTELRTLVAQFKVDSNGPQNTRHLIPPGVQCPCLGSEQGAACDVRAASLDAGWFADRCDADKETEVESGVVGSLAFWSKRPYTPYTIVVRRKAGCGPAPTL